MQTFYSGILLSQSVLNQSHQISIGVKFFLNKVASLSRYPQGIVSKALSSTQSQTFYLGYIVLYNGRHKVQACVVFCV